MERAWALNQRDRPEFKSHSRYLFLTFHVDSYFDEPQVSYLVPEDNAYLIGLLRELGEINMDSTSS